MEAYKERFLKEYNELKERYNKLHKMIVKAEAKTLDFELDCPLDLLKQQAKAMGEYLHILEIRAEIEHINLNDWLDANNTVLNILLCKKD